MSDGRDELQQTMNVWEKRYAEAVRATREAQVVTSHLRAAVEALEKLKKDPSAEIEMPTEMPADATVSPATAGPSLAATPKAESSSADDDSDDGKAEGHDNKPTEFPSSFPRRGIAALMDEDEEEESAAS